MAKARVTAKWLKENYVCVRTGYCSVDNLLRYEEPQYYTSGSGWGCDAYIVYVDGKNVCLTTGYAPVDNVKNKDTKDIADKYEKQAKELKKEYFSEWSSEKQQELQDKMHLLVVQFLQEVLK